MDQPDFKKMFPESLYVDRNALEKEFQKRDQEIARLKGLVEDMWWFRVENKYYPHHHYEVNKELYQQFKKENYL